MTAISFRPSDGPPTPGDLYFVNHIGFDILWQDPFNVKNKDLMSLFPLFSNLSGEIVVFKESISKFLYKFSLPNNSAVEFCCHKSFVTKYNQQPKEQSDQEKCKCNVFITGCICGVFQKELRLNDKE